MADKKKPAAGAGKPPKDTPADVAVMTEEDFNEEDLRSPGLFSRMKDSAKNKFNTAAGVAKTVLDPRNIAHYILTRLWKPLLLSLLMLTLFFGGAYAASYYRLFDARTALDFEWAMPSLRAAGDPVTRELLPVAEWSVVAAAAAGDLIQTDVERREVARIKEEQERQRQKEEQEKQEKLAQQTPAAGEQKPAGERENAGEEERRRAAERSKQEAELKRIAERRQQELNQRASKLAAYYATMQPADAVKILANMDDEEIIVILNRMPDAMVSQILAGFAPERASALSQQILGLRMMPDLERAEAGLL